LIEKHHKKVEHFARFTMVTGAAESDSDAAGLEDSDGKAIQPVPDNDEENAQSEASDDVRIQTYQSTFGKVCACLGVSCVFSVCSGCVYPCVVSHMDLCI